jgi:hypothetical protein
MVTANITYLGSLEKERVAQREALGASNKGSPHLTVDKALSLIVSYEAFMRYSVIPGVVQLR